MLLVVMNIGCDQVSKTVVRETVDYHQKIPVIADHLILTKVENTGAMLSAGSNLPPALKLLFLKGIPAIAILLMLGYMVSKTALDRWTAVALAFVCGGGIGNIFDRFAYGSVTDFLHLDLGWLQTGIFNLADVSIMVGTALFLVAYLVKTFGAKPTNPSVSPS